MITSAVLAGFLRKHKDKLKSKIPFYVGGEECFCAREWVAPPLKGNFGALDRRALEDADVTVTFAEGPAIVADHGFTAGQIGLSSFEKVLSPTTMKIGLDHHIGCYPEKFTEDERKREVFRPIPPRDCDDLQLEGSWPGGADVLQSSRRGECHQGGADGFGRSEGACRAGRFPPGAA